MKKPKSSPVAFLVNTSKWEKIARMQGWADSNGYDAVFYPSTVLSRPIHSAEEDAGTQPGNAAQKMDEFYDYLKALTPDLRSKTALNRMLSSDSKFAGRRIILLVDDSGGTFMNSPDDYYSGVKERFQQAFFNLKRFDLENPKQKKDHDLIFGLITPPDHGGKALINPENPNFPGAELVHLLSAIGGVKNVIRMFKEACEYAGIETDITKTRRENCLVFNDKCTLFATYWQPRRPFTYGKYDFEKTFATTSVMRFDEPNVPSPQFYDYLIPWKLFQNNSRKSQGELGGDYLTPHVRAKALEELFKTLKVAKNLPSKISQGIAQPISIATIGRPTGLIGALSHTCNEIGIKLQTRTIEDSTKLPEEQVLVDDVLIFPARPNNGNGTNGSKNGHSDDDQEIFDFPAIFDTLSLAYAMVHKQLDPTGRQKMILAVNENESRTPQLDLIYDMSRQGAFGEHPSQFLKVCQSNNELLLYLKSPEFQQFSKRYYKVEPDAQKEGEIKKFDSGQYMLGIFTSASLEGYFHRMNYESALKLLEANIGLVFGIADRPNAMGAIYHAGLKFEQKNPGRDYFVGGSSVPNILTAESVRGKKPERIKDENFYLAPTITHRMRCIIGNSHAIAVEGDGGIGTAQEILKVIYMMVHNRELIQGRPLIIETAQVRNSEAKPLWDNLFKIMLKGRDYRTIPESKLREKGLFIVENDEHMRDTVYDLRKILVESLGRPNRFPSPFPS